MPRPRIRHLVPLTLAVLAAATAATTAGAVPHRAGPSAGAARGATITIRNFAFSPRTLRIRRGTVVTVRNVDLANHTFTARHGEFELSNLNTGQSGRVRFNRRGTFAYACVIHPFMHGTIVVR